MAKVKVIFNLEIPEDNERFELFCNSQKMSYALNEINNNLKKSIRWHIDSKKNINPYELLDLIFEKISDIQS